MPLGSILPCLRSHARTDANYKHRACLRRVTKTSQQQRAEGSMRVTLNVPYEEKDKAKRLGARWDAARRVWYVEDLPNLVPFLRWMPKHLKKPTKPLVKPEKPVAKASVATETKPKKQCNRIRKSTARTDFSLRDTGCSCVPWEWCSHNPEPANHRPAFVYRPQHYVEYVSPENMAHIRSILAE